VKKGKPEIPDGETEEKMEEKVNQLKKVCRSSRPDQSVVQSVMLETYPIRRKAVLEQTNSISSSSENVTCKCMY
jgi:hypothetical protein